MNFHNFQIGDQMNPSNQWTPDLLNQWSNNQELIYQNLPHDKVDWGSLAKQWHDMQNTIMRTPQLNPHLFTDFQFLQVPTPQPNFLTRPTIHFNNLNSNNFQINNLQPPQFQQPNYHHFNPNFQNHHFQNHHFTQLNPPFNQTVQFNQLDHHNLQQPNTAFIHQTHQIPPPPPPQSNFLTTRKEPPLLPPFESQLATSQFNNQFNYNNRNLDEELLPNKFNDQNDDYFKKDLNKDDKKLNFDNDKNEDHFNEKIEDDNSKLKSTQQSTNKLKQSINHHLKINKPNNSHKINHQIPNQLDQESTTTDDSQTVASNNNNLIDANKRKSLPQWIKEGLEKMEKEKQKKIDIEEDLKKKAKEDQLRKELDSEEKEDEVDLKNDKITVKNVENKKIFSSSNLHNRKTFADMFLVKKESKNYYYENEEEREKELTLRTRKILTNILIEVTDALIRQVAIQSIQEAKIQKFTALSKQLLAKPKPKISSGLVGIVSQYYSDSEEEEKEENSSTNNKEADTKRLEKNKSNDQHKKKEDSKRKDKSRRSRSTDRRKRSLSRDHHHKRRSKSKERNRRSRSRGRENSSRLKDHKRENNHDDRSKKRSRSRKRSRSNSKSKKNSRSSRDHSSKHSRNRSRSSSRRRHRR